MPKKPDETAEKPQRTHTKFAQIMGDAEAIYALDADGRVFIYVDDDDSGEHGWYQLEYDDIRVLAPPPEADDD